MKCAVLFSSLLLALDCSGQGAASGVSAQAQQATVEVAPLGFRVNVKLSDQAMQKLVQSKETIIVAGYLSGNPKKGAAKKYIDEMGLINLGEIRNEVAPGESANFGEVRLPQKLLAQTDGRDPELNINVFSGRRSSENNLLDCSFHEAGLKATQGHSIDITCKLIGE